MRLLKWAVVIEVAYVLLFNALLQLPLTQTALNAIRPDKFQVAWDEAWTWYPFRVHVRGGYANGNAPGQIWEIEVPAASASIALWQLPFLNVHVHDVRGRDIVYRQRPRPRPDRDYAPLEPYFPVIAGREIRPAEPPKPKHWYAWDIVVEGIEVSGTHRYWIYQLQGALEGSARANLRYRAPGGGPLELEVFDLVADLRPHYLQHEELFQRGRIRGSLGFVPFMPREHRDPTLLNFLRLDLDLDLDAQRLAFIDLFLLKYPGMKVRGQGEVSGRLRFAEGWVRSGTDLRIEAEDLRVAVLSHDIEGQGAIGLKLGEDTGEELDLNFWFRDLEVRSHEEREPLLVGQGLLLGVGGSGRVVPPPGDLDLNRSISLAIDSLAVPDLALLQGYLPAKWPGTLFGGEGVLRGAVRLHPTAFELDLKLDSENADLGIGPYRFLTNLNSGLIAHNPNVLRGGSRLDGSFLVLSNAYLRKEGGLAPTPWSASLLLNQAEFELFGDADRDAGDNVMDLIDLLGDAEAKEALALARGLFDFEAQVSSLAWLGVFLQQEYNGEVSGSSQIRGRLHLESGMPAPGTHVEVESDGLAVRILDYLSRGDGRIVLEVHEGGLHPDWSLAVRLEDADMRRVGETAASIHDVTLMLDALIEDVSFEPDRRRQFDLKLRIPHAQVREMSVFNRYLPPDTPIRITGGQAELAVDIALQHDDADGWLRLDAKSIDAVADAQQIVLDLDVDVRLVGGVPADMRFDFDGSRVTIDNVRVAGERQVYDEEGWSAVLVLTRAETVWQDPPRLSFEADLEVSDSRPFVTLFANQGWRPAFLTRALTVEDLRGQATLHMQDDALAIPHAVLTSDDIELGGKGRIAGEDNDGVVYARYRKADALLRIRNGRRNVDLFDARGKYERYEVPP